MYFRNSTKSTVAILTALIFMLSMICYFPPLQANETEELPLGILETVGGEITNQDDETVLGTVYEDNNEEILPENLDEEVTERGFNLNNFQPMEVPDVVELSISDVTNSSFKVSWTEATGATMYNVTVSNTTGGVTTKVVDGASTQDTEYEVTDLQPSYRYDIEIEVVDGSWAGDVTLLQGLAITGRPFNEQGNQFSTFDFISGAPYSGGPRYVFTPPANLDGENDFEKFFTYKEEINPNNDRFLWYLQLGLNGINDINGRAWGNSFRLFNVTDNVEIPLDYGNADFGIGIGKWPECGGVSDDNDVLTRLITSGDFKAAHLSKSGDWGKNFIRFELDIAKYIKPGKQYEIILDPNPQCNTGARNPLFLNKVYHFKFNTIPSIWAEGASLTVDSVGATTAVLRWPSVDNPNNISGYALYVNGVLEDNHIPSTQTFYDMEGLSPSKKYTFKIVAKAKKGSHPELSSTIVTGGKFPLTFTTDPFATLDETAYSKDYNFTSPVDLDNFYLSWNFAKGIDKNLQANLEGIRVYEKSTGADITLNKGVYPYEREDETGNIIAGDFKYTKLGGGGGTGGELRLLSFEPTEATLRQFEKGKQYVLEMQPDFLNNNGENTLGKITSFSFSIADDDNEKPEWPAGAVITPSAIGPNGMLLTWPVASDNSGFIKEYQIIVNNSSVIKVSGLTTSYKLTGLAKDTLYNIVIKALDAKNNESDNLILSQKTSEADITPPIWETGKALTIKNVATDNLDLYWTKAIDDIELAGYKIYQNNAFIKNVPADVTNLHVTGLIPNTQYTFQVQAYDAAGNTTTDGPLKLIATLDGPVDKEAPTWTGGDTTTSIKYSVVSASITLTWPWAVDNIAVAGYEIYCEDEYVATVDSTKNSYTDIKTVDGNRYTYKVYAFDPSGNRSLPVTFAAVYTGDPDADITPPYWPSGSNITLSNFGEDSVLINWSSAEDNIGVTNYLVKNGQLWIRGIFEGDEYPSYVSFDERYFFYSPDTYNANNFGDTSQLDLVEGRPTTFSIKAYDRPQNSTMGDPTITFYPGINPTAGSGIPFRLKNVANTRGTLNSITGAVNQVTNPTDPVETVFEFEFDKIIASDYMDKIKLYNQKTGDEIDISTMLTKTTAESNDTIIISNKDKEPFEQGETYKLVMAADLAAIDSTKLGFPIAWEFTTATNDKEPPSFAEDAELSVTFKIAPHVATLTWSEATDNVGVTEYIIYKDDEEVATVNSNVLTYDVEGLTPENQYSFKIVARDYLGNRSIGLIQDVTAPSENTEKPTFSGNMTFTEVSSDNLTINWPAASAKYAIKEYEVYKENEYVATVSGKTLSYTITGLIGETSYNFSVVARDYSNNESQPLTGSYTTELDTIKPIWPENAILGAKNIESNSLKLYWTAATDNVAVTKYTIYKDGIVLGTVESGTEYSVTGLSPSTRYTFTVEAEDLKENKTETMLKLEQYTAIAKTSEGANFGFELTNVPNENISIGEQVINTVTVNTLAQTASFRFNFERELKANTWLTNIELVKSTQPNKVIELDASAFVYNANGGKSTLVITIPESKLPETGEYQLRLIKDLQAFDDTTIGKDYIWKFNVTAANYSIIDVAGGYNSYSSRNNPSDRYYLVVKSDGTVWGWGNNDYGHLGDGTTQRADLPTQTLGLTNIVKVYSGRDSSFALDQDGYLYGWGSNEYGQLGRGVLPLGTSGRHGNNLPVRIEGIPKIVDISYGFQRVVALDVNGNVWTWGFRTSKWQSPYGVLSTGTPEKVPGLSNIVSVEAGYNYSLAIDNNGDVYYWTSTDPEFLKKIEELDEIKAVSSYGNNYGYRNLALRKDGTVWMWGHATLAQVTTEEDNQQVMNIMQVEGAKGIKEIYADTLSMLTPDRKVQQINAEINDENSFANAGNILTGFNNISKMATFAHGGMINNPLMDGFVSSGIFLQMDGTLQTFEKITTAANAPDLTNAEVPVWPTEAEIKIKNNTEKGMTITWDSCGDNIVAYALYKDGVLLANVPASTLSYDIIGLNKDTSYTYKVEARYASSEYSKDGPSITVSTLASWEPNMKGMNQVAAGIRHSLLVDAEGKVWAWGENDYGQLGNSTTTSSNIPVVVNMLDNITQVVVGDNHSVALDSDGDVWVWGDNSQYQLGNGDTTNSNIPIKIASLSGIVNISAAGNYTLAVKDDGTLWSWGSGTFGGNNMYILSESDGHTPVKIRYNTARSVEGNFDLADIKMAAASRNFIAVLFSDGTVSRIGKFRDSVGAPTYSHMAMHSLNKTNIMGVQAISAGDEFFMALLEDGTVAVLGDNNQGQYGVGNRNNPTPANPIAYAKVSGLSDVTAISAGSTFGLALKEDGTVWGWGQNNKGQLGNNNIVTETKPTQMSNVFGVNAIGAGDSFSIIASDNNPAKLEVYATGDNEFGQLGNAKYENSLIPRLVMFETVEDTEAPTFPINFAITAFKNSATSATIIWSDAMDNIGVASYKLFDESGNLIATLASGINEYQVTDLVEGVTKSYYIKAYDFKGNESMESIRVTFDIATLAERPELFDPFTAMITNVANGDKDVAINTSFEITFSEPIIINNDITNGNAIKLLMAGTTTPVAASYILSMDGKELTVKPKADLLFGTDYSLHVTSQVKNASGTLVAFPTAVEFSTCPFDRVTATATVIDDSVDLEVKLTNLSSINKDIIVKYVVRRGKGARLEQGGIVVIYGEKNENAILAGLERGINISIPDISKDAYGNLVSGDAYIDIYVTNTSGLLMVNPIHLSIK